MKAEMWLVAALIVVALSTAAIARDTYQVSIGPSGWSAASEAGLIGVSAEVELIEESASVEGVWGLGEHCAQGWALWPRLYLVDKSSTWRPFGELGLAQFTDLQLRLDLHCGSMEKHSGWRFVGLGLGMVYRLGERMLRLSGGVGLTIGQCPMCGISVYLAIRVGHFWE
ncbi:hypothetical protein HY009_06925 [Candidatus Acetothermia bacterium]|nr:hypothetical protein [Candidatus Acetothermia bacterium]